MIISVTGGMGQNWLCRVIRGAIKAMAVSFGAEVKDEYEKPWDHEFGLEVEFKMDEKDDEG